MPRLPRTPGFKVFFDGSNGGNRHASLPLTRAQFREMIERIADAALKEKMQAWYDSLPKDEG
jgi:hypothetical protein